VTARDSIGGFAGTSWLLGAALLGFALEASCGGIADAQPLPTRRVTPASAAHGPSDSLSRRALLAYSAERAYASDRALCNRRTASQRDMTVCWATRQRVRTEEALAAYARAVAATKDYPEGKLLPATLQAWERYRDTSCAVLAAAWEGGSLAESVGLQCRARRAMEFTEAMYGVLLNSMD
jgi:uncharacterized protein YecT (DUF1311 family)